MRSPPADLATAHLRDALTEGWALRGLSLEYLAEGGGAHHWRADDEAGHSHFVTVDDLDDKEWLGTTRDAVFAGLDQALGTAAVLRDNVGLEFVLAPVRGRAGQIVARLSDRYALSVLPFRAGRSYPFGPYPDDWLADQALELVVALHGATPEVRQSAPGHAPGFGGRTDLEAFLAEPERIWDSGPFSETTGAVLAPRARDLSRLVAAFDQLVELTAPSRTKTVITHGEPHPANLISADGRLFLVDWDTVALAPPERDLALILDTDPRGAVRYGEATGHPVDAQVMRLYRLRWYLDDLGSAVRMFRRRHTDTADSRRWSAGLPRQLNQLSAWIRTTG